MSVDGNDLGGIASDAWGTDAASDVGPRRPWGRQSGTYRQGGSKKVREEGRCRACHTIRRPLTRHHLIPQRLGGQNFDENLIPVCQPCHNEIEHPHKVRRGLARSRLREQMTDAEKVYCVRFMGPHWFNREYPLTERDALHSTATDGEATSPLKEMTR